MAAAWATAFLIAAILALAGTPVLRRLAVRWDVLDQPAHDRKVHTSPVPYLGGVAIIAGAVVGTVIGPGIAPKIAAIAFGGCAIGSVGLLDDRRPLSPRLRLGAQLVAAALALVVGVRVHATHVAAIDVVLTLVWIVGITNAFNLLDNMDGLAGGTAAAAAIAVFCIAAFGGEVVVATLAAALTGACLGFLAYNVRPASIFMGDAGALFLGYVLAIATLELEPDLTPPASFVVPIMILLVPIIDTTLVSVARMRRGRPVTFGGRDHLSHRLVARGWTPGSAVGFLVAVELAAGIIATAAGRSILALPIAVGAALVLAVVVVAPTVRVRVYDVPVVGFARRHRIAAGVVAIIVAAFAVPAGLALVQSRRDLEVGATNARLALRAAANGDQAAALAAFRQSEHRFRRAHIRLRSVPVRVGTAIPVVSTNLRAARALAAVGTDLSRDGKALASAIDPRALQVSAGRVPIDAFTGLVPTLRRGATILGHARRETNRIDRSYLLPPVTRAVDTLRSRVARAERSARKAVAAAEVLPKIMGTDRTRRYFLAVQNTAELRATGGFIGNFGEITAQGGQLSLGRFGRISELNGTGSEDRVLRAPDDFLRRYGRFQIPHTWQNVNMSPDFPTVANVIANLYPQSGGQAIDGVIGVDPEGLAALLSLTGPVSLAGWPEPLTSANVVPVTLRDEYEHFTDRTARAQFLGAVANEVWRKLTTATLPAPARIGAVLGEAARSRHLLMAVTDQRDERLLDQLGVTGRVPNVRADSILLVNQNAAGSKVDYYLHRKLDVDVHIEPEDRARPSVAAVQTKVAATFDNRAPAGGLATEAIGPFSADFDAGENRTFVSLYTNHDFTKAIVDGQSVPLESALELDRHVYSTYVRIPAEQRRSLAIQLTGGVRLGAGGWYALDVMKQPTVVDDALNVKVTVAAGWRIAETVNLERVGRRRARIGQRLDHDTTVWVRVARDGARGFFDRLGDNEP